MTNSGKPARVVYRATGARRLTLSIMLLLLLPFVASVPIMLWQRVSQGIWLGTAGLMLLGSGLTAILVLLAINLMQALRTRVAFGDEAVELSLPAGRGPTPLLRYATNKVRYDQVQAVETRSEIYGGALAPVMLTGARLITKEGQSIRLGYINSYNEDPHLPVVEIARQIAERAGIEILDRGAVHRSAANKAFGIASVTPAIAPQEIEHINRRHRLMAYGFGGLMAIVLLLGIVADLKNPVPGGTPAASVAKAPPPTKTTPKSKK